MIKEQNQDAQFSFFVMQVFNAIKQHTANSIRVNPHTSNCIKYHARNEMGCIAIDAQNVFFCGAALMYDKELRDGQVNLHNRDGDLVAGMTLPTMCLPKKEESNEA